MDELEENEVWDQKHIEKGVITFEDDETDGCEMEGCTGHAVTVKWPDGEETNVCSASLKLLDDGTQQIMS